MVGNFAEKREFATVQRQNQSLYKRGYRMISKRIKGSRLYAVVAVSKLLNIYNCISDKSEPDKMVIKRRPSIHTLAQVVRKTLTLLE